MKPLIVACLLAGCASVQPPAPSPYSWAAQEASRRVIIPQRNMSFFVGSQNWHRRDYTAVPAGEERWGNCATYAATAVAILKEKGIDAAEGECNSKWGQHAFAVIVGKGIVIESVYQTPVPFAAMGCK